MSTLGRFAAVLWALSSVTAEAAERPNVILVMADDMGWAQTGYYGQSINAVHDGISIAPVFEAEPARRSQPMGFRASGGVAWIDNDFKLVRNYTAEDPDAFELYNLIGDPREEQDLIHQRPELAAPMLQQLQAWSRSVDASIEGKDYPEGKVLPSSREKFEAAKPDPSDQ